MEKLETKDFVINPKDCDLDAAIKASKITPQGFSDYDTELARVLSLSETSEGKAECCKVETTAEINLYRQLDQAYIDIITAEVMNLSAAEERIRNLTDMQKVEYACRQK